MGWAEAVSNLQETCGRTFGVEATYEPFGGSPHTVQLMFRDESLEFEPGTDTPHLVPTPAAELPRSALTADPIPLAGAAIKDTVIIPVGGVKYAVTRAHNDGFGQLTLSLRLHT
jgi:hypothetical protein